MTIILTEEEIEALTGYRLATMQLERLRKDGFYRARMGRRGVILERSHYDAVTRGEDSASAAPRKVANLSHLTDSNPKWIGTKSHAFHENRLRERDEYAAQLVAEAEALKAATEARLKAEREHRDKMRPIHRAALVRHHAAKRRVAMLKRTPPWANQAVIRAVYDEALRLTRETGTEHHVDHIIPLQGELVSGLHVENNLQVLPWRENILKRNNFEVDA